MRVPVACTSRAGDVLDLAQELAGPVARGVLPEGQAEAALLALSLRLERAGVLSHDPIDLARIAAHITRLNADNIAARRETSAIRRVLRPLLGIGARSNRLRAAAHDKNGAHGFPLIEDEVEEVAQIEAWHFMQRFEKGRSHG